MTGALDGIKILDLSRYAPGPYCTMILGDLGADVITVVQGTAAQGVPEFPTPGSPWDYLNRNKRSIGLNLKSPIGPEIIHRLVKEADVVVESFRPGVVKRLGIDYDTLKPINEMLIYCSITGYGQYGPWASLPGHDVNYIAQGGALGIMLKPVIPGNIIGDMAGGGMQAAVAILAALFARTHTHRGQYIDISITDGVISLLGLYIANHLLTGTLPPLEDRTSVGASPFYGVYETKDGKFISIAAHPEPKFWKNLCGALHTEHLIPMRDDKAYAEEIRHVFRTTFLKKTRDEWFDILREADTPVGKVSMLEDIISDPHVAARRMIVETEDPIVGTVRQVGIPMKLSDTPGTIRKLPSRPAEDTQEILGELGYSQNEICKMIAANAVMVEGKTS
jgi:crotonobetainyl-CoA:carnitine CoA-transferase CaiB-like acyl-CoA transferase